jgi:hypothetical protein
MKIKELLNEDWNKVNHKDKTDGLSQKAVNAYRRENPGSKLQTAVTTKPSKLKKGSKAAKRRKSFCARMSGNKGPMKKPNGKPTPKALALRRWNCESIEEMQELIRLGEQHIINLKQSLLESDNRCMQCGMINCKCPGKSCKCKPIKGWVPGKGFKKAMDEAALNEKWSQKYKSSINCSHPKGFSQRAHCAGKKKHNESMDMELVCEDCGMCATHGNLNEIKKGQKDSNGFTKCWSGYHAAGTKKGKNGKSVRNCVPNESMMPSSTFVGSKQNKINGKGMMKATAKHARPGDLVGGG